MLWNDRMYLGAGVEERYRRIKWKVMHNKPQIDIFLLVLPLKYEQHLQLIHSSELLQKKWPKDHLCVVGIAQSKFEGLDLIEQITADMLKETGVVDYYGFFQLNKPENQ